MCLLPRKQKTVASFLPFLYKITTKTNSKNSSKIFGSKVCASEIFRLACIHLSANKRIMLMMYMAAADHPAPYDQENWTFLYMKISVYIARPMMTKIPAMRNMMADLVTGK